MRSMQVIAFVFAALLAASANSQDLNGSFSTGPFGETFKVEGHGDGTADIYHATGRHIGVAEDNGYGHWDIHAIGGGRIGEIQEKGDGSFEANDAQGGHWGSGKTTKY